MRKVVVFLMVLTLTLSTSLTALGASDKSNGGGKGHEKSTVQTEKVNYQKQFKFELNAEKKMIAEDLGDLQTSLAEKQADCDSLIALGDGPSLAEAAAIQLEIADLEAQMAPLQAAMKEVINQRYMITKTLYSDEQLSQFETAADVITAMYEDITVLDLGSITVHNNLIVLEAPAYIKGGKTMLPIQAIQNVLGKDMTYVVDEGLKTVTFTQGDTTVVFGINSTQATLSQAETVADLDPDLTGDEAGNVSGTIAGTASGAVAGTFSGTLGTTTTDPDTGAITGTVTGTVTDPVTGLPTEVTGQVVITKTVNNEGTPDESITYAVSELTLDSITTALESPAAAEITCGRAYVPLKYLAEIYGVDVSYDSATETIEVDLEDTDEAATTPVIEPDTEPTV